MLREEQRAFADRAINHIRKHPLAVFDKRSLAKDRRVLALCVVLLFIFSSYLIFYVPSKTEAAGNVYYVAGTGSDSDPETQPWKTIQKACDDVRPNDTVYIRGGTYNENPVLKRSGNSSGEMITFCNYPGEEVWIDGTGIGGSVFWAYSETTQISYVKIKGLRFKNWGQTIVVDGKGNIIEGCEIKDAVGGIWFSPAASHTVSDCAATSNHIHDIYTQDWAHGTGVAFEAGDGVVRNCTAKRNKTVHCQRGLGSNVTGTGAVEDCILDANEVRDCKEGIGLLKATGITVRENRVYDCWDAGIYDDGRDCTFDGNYIEHTTGGPNITIGANGITLRRNISVNSTMGIIIESGSDIRIYNNTTYGNNSRGIFIKPGVSGAKVKNNISFEPSADYAFSAVSSAISELDHNLWYASGDIAEYDGQGYLDFDTYRNGTAPHEVHSFSSDPRFLSPEGKDFALQSSSPAIDAGADVGLSYNGHAPDMGAIEFGGTSWFFAEGYTGSGFQEYLTLQNPNPTSANVTIEYIYRWGGGTSQNVTVGPNTRETIDVNAVVGPGKEVSAELSSDQPIVAERPMYFSYKNDWTGGHNVIGAKDADTTFYFAEGYTGPGFDEWLCLLNPSSVPANVTVEYSYRGGGGTTQNITVGANTRETVDVNAAAGANKELSVKVVSDQPVIAERPVYFNYQGIWIGGHDVVGYSP